jgi:hypothetical protein
MHPTNAAFIAAHTTTSAVGPEAQVGALLAKARWQAAHLDQLEAAHVDRRVVAETWRSGAAHIRAAIPTIPDRYAAWLATTLDKPEAVARQILERCVTVLLTEVHTPEQAFDAAMRLP